MRQKVHLKTIWNDEYNAWAPIITDANDSTILLSIIPVFNEYKDRSYASMMALFHANVFGYCCVWDDKHPFNDGIF